jgi:SAM-dependent methyltransferase
MSDTTQGYADEAPELLVRYESYAFDVAHRDVLHLLPTAPAAILDIGAGTGRDAAYLDAAGHRVLAVEPTAALREGAMRLHPSPSIRWLDDRLPDLAHVRALNERFELIWLSAVWMHFDAATRAAAMATLASLLTPAGAIMMTLRHGPVPEGRRMYEVTADETMALAAEHNLVCRLNAKPDESQRGANRAGVSWTRLWFARD